MERILLTVMFVLSLFLMCGGCENEHHARRGERWDRERDLQSREQWHDERR